MSLGPADVFDRRDILTVIVPGFTLLFVLGTAFAVLTRNALTFSLELVLVVTILSFVIGEVLSSLLPMTAPGEVLFSKLYSLRSCLHRISETNTDIRRSDSNRFRNPATWSRLGDALSPVKDAPGTAPSSDEKRLGEVVSGFKLSRPIDNPATKRLLWESVLWSVTNERNWMTVLELNEYIEWVDGGCVGEKPVPTPYLWPLSPRHELVRPDQFGSRLRCSRGFQPASGISIWKLWSLAEWVDRTFPNWRTTIESDLTKRDVSNPVTGRKVRTLWDVVSGAQLSRWERQGNQEALAEWASVFTGESLLWQDVVRKARLERLFNEMTIEGRVRSFVVRRELDQFVRATVNRRFASRVDERGVPPLWWLFVHLTVEQHPTEKADESGPLSSMWSVVRSGLPLTFVTWRGYELFNYVVLGQTILRRIPSFSRPHEVLGPVLDPYYLLQRRRIDEKTDSLSTYPIEPLFGELLDVMDGDWIPTLDFDDYASAWQLERDLRDLFLFVRSSTTAETDSEVSYHRSKAAFLYNMWATLGFIWVTFALLSVAFASQLVSPALFELWASAGGAMGLVLVQPSVLDLVIIISLTIIGYTVQGRLSRRTRLFAQESVRAQLAAYVSSRRSNTS